MAFTLPKNDDYIKTMGDERRALFLKIWGGFQPHEKITHPFYYLYSHFPCEKLDAALKWLARNKKTGIHFVSFYYECGGSLLSLHKKLLQILDSEKNAVVRMGVNFRE